MGKDSCNDFGVKIKVKFGLMSVPFRNPIPRRALCRVIESNPFVISVQSNSINFHELFFSFFSR